MADFQEPRTTAVLLAAGSGSRLGLGPKALLPFRGRTLVEVLAGVLLAGGCREVVVVLGADAVRVAEIADLAAYTVVQNPDWQTGMGGSFRMGVAAATTRDHVLIALVDQPGLTADIVARLLMHHRPGRVTAAAYRGADGVAPAWPSAAAGRNPACPGGGISNGRRRGTRLPPGAPGADRPGGLRRPFRRRGPGHAGPAAAAGVVASPASRPRSTPRVPV